MSSTLDAVAAQLSLTVRTGDSQSEILVLDARGRPVGRGAGPERTFELEPGIYRVKVLTGAEVQEKSVVLIEPQGGPLQFEQVAFASPVPLMGTSTSHEYHMSAADHESKVTHVADGAGSSLFFLVRDWTPPSEQAAKPRVTGNPAEGLSLHMVNANGERKICDLAASGESNASGDPWAACTLEVAPGVYELRLALPDGETLRQSFVASQGWQTQSFIFMRDYPSENGPRWRADLSRTSVLHSQTRGFSPNESLLRVTELARIALATKGPGERGQTDRRLVPDDMRTLLREKFGNPMLGIYAAHLLLLEASVDVELFREVVGNLRTVLGRQHPDVEALALRAPGEPAPLPFENPPMLSRSWSLMVEATVAQPSLVTESLSQRHLGKSLTDGLWHTLRSPSEGAQVSDPNALGLSDVEAALAEDLGVMKNIRWINRTSTVSSPPVRRARITGLPRRPAFSDQFSAVLRDHDDAPPPSVDNDLPDLAVTKDFEVQIDQTRLRSLVTRCGIPATQLKRTLTSLEEKLTRNPNVPNLKVWLK
jgi:hypothetical protein